MIWVIFGVSFVLAVIMLAMSMNSIIDEISLPIGFAAMVVAGLSFFIGIFVTVSAVNSVNIDDKIAMYQEENAAIEEQISDMVEAYMQYESDVFTEIADKSPITIVTLYPELKSDKLVESQIEIYIDNNSKIKSLKESKIDANVTRWWAYFGK